MRTIDVLKKGFNPENSQKTQISSTLATYLKIEDHIIQNAGFGNQTVLDYGSGLGHGFKYYIQQGWSIDAYEPYYNSVKGVYSPNYTNNSGKLLDNRYSVIISNCVLNVLPDDNRKMALWRMFRMLSDDGKIYINVQSLSAIKKTMKKGTVLSDTEVLTTRGTYQKGFTNRTLKSYIKSILPNARIEKGIGTVSCIIYKS